jgi:hypothetical protein
MIFFGLTLCIISALVLTTERRVERLNQQEQLAKNIELKVGELSFLSNDYLSFPAEWGGRKQLFIYGSLIQGSKRLFPVGTRMTPLWPIMNDLVFPGW